MPWGNEEFLLKIVRYFCKVLSPLTIKDRKILKRLTSSRYVDDFVSWFPQVSINRTSFQRFESRTGRHNKLLPFGTKLQLSQTKFPRGTGNLEAKGL